MEGFDNKRKPKSYKEVLDKAMEAFGYDKDKALNWYMTKSPALGNKSPFEICKMGKTAKMIRVLEKVTSIQ